MGPKKKAAEKPKGKEAGAGGKAAKGKGGGKDNKAADRDKPTKLKGGQKIDVQHILCTKMSTKDEVHQEIMLNPTLTNFTEVAKRHSEDKKKIGGVLGWKTKGELAPEFEEVAYGLEISSGSKLAIGQAKTSHGYHLIVVRGRG